MIILCTGLLRSGSTWSFNVCRQLFRQTYKDGSVKLAIGYADGVPLDELIRANQDDSERILIVKSHFPGAYAVDQIESGQLPNICTLRDPRDSFVSLNSYDEMTFDEIKDYVLKNLRYIDKYERKDKSLFIDFEDMMANSLAAVGRIADYLKLNLSEEIILEVDEQTNIDSARKTMNGLSDRDGSDSVHKVRSHLVDNLTFIHEKHVQSAKSGRWKTELSQDEQRRVNEAFAPWLLSMGYETSDSIERD
jgi:hypothetical protein